MARLWLLIGRLLKRLLLLSLVLVLVALGLEGQHGDGAWAERTSGPNPLRGRTGPL
jgi:hypothetical protein